jgi:hypothetical protein
LLSHEDVFLGEVISDHEDVDELADALLHEFHNSRLIFFLGGLTLRPTTPHVVGNPSTNTSCGGCPRVLLLEPVAELELSTTGCTHVSHEVKIIFLGVHTW